MLIHCPDCEAGFEVPDERLRPGRMVKCARCHATWMPIAPLREAVVEAEPEPPPEAAAADPVLPESWPAYEPLVPARHELRETDRGRATVLMAWLLSLAVLGGVVGGAYAARSDVMRLWPPSQRVYDMVGLHPS